MKLKAIVSLLVTIVTEVNKVRCSILVLKLPASLI